MLYVCLRRVCTLLLLGVGFCRWLALVSLRSSSNLLSPAQFVTVQKVGNGSLQLIITLSISPFKLWQCFFMYREALLLSEYMFIAAMYSWCFDLVFIAECPPLTLVTYVLRFILFDTHSYYRSLHDCLHFVPFPPFNFNLFVSLNLKFTCYRLLEESWTLFSNSSIQLLFSIFFKIFKNALFLNIFTETIVSLRKLIILFIMYMFAVFSSACCVCSLFL